MVFSVLGLSLAKTTFKALFGRSPAMEGLFRWRGIVPFAKPGAGRLRRIIGGTLIEDAADSPLAERLTREIPDPAIKSHRAAEVLVKRYQQHGDAGLSITGLAAEEEKTFRRLLNHSTVDMEEVKRLQEKLKLGHSASVTSTIGTQTYKYQHQTLSNVVDYAATTVKARTMARSGLAMAGGIGATLLATELAFKADDAVKKIGRSVTDAISSRTQMLFAYDTTKGFLTSQNPQAMEERSNLQAYLKHSRVSSFTSEYGNEAARLHGE